MSLHSKLKRNTYIDSVTLMAISTAVNKLTGVKQAQIAMGSPMNKAVLQELNLLDNTIAEAAPSDLMIVVSLENGVDANDIFTQIEGLLTRKPNTQNDQKETVYHTLATAAEAIPESNFVIISVNGQFATREAKKALELGKNVMLFSDNVSIEDEKMLKQLAHQKGLLMMGPDCGTAIINGLLILPAASNTFSATSFAGGLDTNTITSVAGS